MRRRKRTLIALVRWLVPREMRDDWQREWEAELDHREAHIQTVRPLTRADRARVFRQTTGAVWDALWLRTSRWQTARSLIHHARVSLPVVVSLGAAMAAMIAAAGLYDALLLRPPGIQDPNRVLTMYVDTPTNEWDTVSPDDLRYYRETSHMFSGLAAFPAGISTMTAPDLQDRFVSMAVSENYFDLLGVTPRLGSLTFPSGSDAPKELVVISEFLWKKLGADPHIVGRPLRIGAATLTIFGVAPASFTGMNWVWRTDVWYPFTAAARLEGRPEVPLTRTDRGLLVLGRLAPGVTMDQAQAEVTGLSARLAATYPDTDANRKAVLVRTTTIPAQERGWIVPALLALVGLALLTLIVAGTNATNLLLGLALSRRHEMLVRTALGASRMQLMSPLLRESVVLTFTAGALGFVAAYGALAALSSHGVSLGPDFPALQFDVRPGISFGTLTALVVIVSGVCIGLLPAWRAASDGISGALSRELATNGSRRHRLRNVLVVVQIAVGTMVLSGLGVAWRSASNIRHADLGFSARNLLAAETSLDMSKLAAQPAIDLHDRLVSTLTSVPGIQAVAFASGMPFESCCDRDMVRSDDGAESSRAAMSYAVVDDAFFTTMGISIVAGRTFGVQDQPRGPEVIVVNRLFADSRWPNQDPIGQRVRIENGNRLVTVIGVVANGKYGSVDEAPMPIMYFDWRQHHRAEMSIIARTAGDPKTLARAVREAFLQIDPNMEVFVLRTLQDDLDLNLLLPNLIVEGFVGLGLLTLVLTTVGLYATVFYSVGQRRREIGIRLALGALPVDVLRMVLWHALLLGGIGVLAGLALSQLALPVAGSVFYGIRPIEAAVLASVGAFTVVVTLIVAFAAAQPWTKVSALEILRSP